MSTQLAIFFLKLFEKSVFESVIKIFIRLEVIHSTNVIVYNT